MQLLQVDMSQIAGSHSTLIIARSPHLPQIFRSGDRRRIEAQVFTELGISKDDFDRLPRPMQQAAWKGEWNMHGSSMMGES